MNCEVHLRPQKDRSHQYRMGYFLTIENIILLVREFNTDCHDGYVSNDRAYIENWLKEHDE